MPEAVPGWQGMRHRGCCSLCSAALPPHSKARHGHLHGIRDLGWGFAWHSSAGEGFACGRQGGGGALGRHQCPGLHLHIGVVAHRCLCIFVCLYICIYVFMCVNLCAWLCTCVCVLLGLGRQRSAGASCCCVGCPVRACVRACLCVCSSEPNMCTGHVPAVFASPCPGVCVHRMKVWV